MFCIVKSYQLVPPDPRPLARVLQTCAYALSVLSVGFVLYYETSPPFLLMASHILMGAGLAAIATLSLLLPAANAWTTARTYGSGGAAKILRTLDFPLEPVSLKRLAATAALRMALVRLGQHLLDNAASLIFGLNSNRENLNFCNTVAFSFLSNVLFSLHLCALALIAAAAAAFVIREAEDFVQWIMASWKRMKAEEKKGVKKTKKEKKMARKLKKMAKKLKEKTMKEENQETGQEEEGVKKEEEKVEPQEECMEAEEIGTENAENGEEEEKKAEIEKEEDQEAEHVDEEVVVDDCLPYAWEERMDSKGRVYFLDYSSRTAQWEHPKAEGMERWEGPEEDLDYPCPDYHYGEGKTVEGERICCYRNRDGVRTMARVANLKKERLQPLEENWEERTDARGRVFYVDHSVGKAQWGHPSVIDLKKKKERKEEEEEEEGEEDVEIELEISADAKSDSGDDSDFVVLDEEEEEAATEVQEEEQQQQENAMGEQQEHIAGEEVDKVEGVEEEEQGLKEEVAEKRGEEVEKSNGEGGVFVVVERKFKME